MKFNFMPDKFVGAIEKLNADKLYELRLRVGFAVLIKYDKNICYLGNDGACYMESHAIICTQNDLDYIIDSVTERSIYAYNDMIKEGYLTTKCGIRIGIAGECVHSDNKIITIKNITSLNIRIPHDILGCSDKIFKYILADDNILNSLIISPPTCGKTTILKDLIQKINALNLGSVLVIDERSEFSMVKGVNIDKIVNSDKLYAFDYGIRSMSPDIVVTDELSGEEDWLCSKHAIDCGIKIIASSHGASIENLREKEFFINGVFERYIILENKKLSGAIKNVYDKDFNLL